MSWLVQRIAVPFNRGDSECWHVGLDKTLSARRQRTRRAPEYPGAADGVVTNHGSRVRGDVCGVIADQTMAVHEFDDCSLLTRYRPPTRPTEFGSQVVRAVFQNHATLEVSIRGRCEGTLKPK